MTTAVTINLALGTIWLIGAVLMMQFGLPRDNAFAAIMGMGVVVHYGLALFANTQNEGN